MKTLEQQWHEIKPKIIKYLDEGWSKSVAYKKAGLVNHTDLYQIHFRNDKEFQEQIKKYSQKSRGFYGVIISIPHQKKRF